MGAEKAGTFETAHEPVSEPLEDHYDLPAREPLNAGPSHLKIAERPVRSRMQRLLDLAASLARETESLARDRAFTEESNRIQGMNVAEGIDFYKEVERFESSLIRLALDQTHGHQARAANLLHIKPTTLNSKIKLYGIEY
jgi:DNA-binding NtrC family response regulator